MPELGALGNIRNTSQQFGKGLTVADRPGRHFEQDISAAGLAADPKGRLTVLTADFEKIEGFRLPPNGLLPKPDNDHRIRNSAKEFLVARR